MKYFKLLLIIGLLLSVATQVSAQVKHKKRAHKKALVTSPPDTYTVKFPKNSLKTDVDAYMLGLAHPVTFIVNVVKPRNITATLDEMADPGNIRISQIIFPNGSTYGPFSKTMKYPVTVKGTYKIIVGGSNMQGDDWKGAFTLHISLM